MSEAITFAVGLIIGALGTVSLFRASLAILQTQVSNLAQSVGEMKEHYRMLERDMNGLGTKLRDEMRDALNASRE